MEESLIKKSPEKKEPILAALPKVLQNQESRNNITEDLKFATSKDESPQRTAGTLKITSFGIKDLTQPCDNKPASPVKTPIVEEK